MDLDDAALLRKFLLGIGGAMIASQEPVDSVKLTLARVSKAYHVDDTEFIVLPTVVLVQVDGVIQGRGTIREGAIVTFRFDQIAELHTVIKAAERGELEPVDGIRRLNEIGAKRPRFGWLVRTLGHAVLTAGLSLLLQPTWQGLLVSVGLGLFIGLVKLVRSPSLQLVFPVVAAFICALVVFAVAEPLGIGNPLVLLVAPLVTFLPGGMLTTGTRELATGQAIAGSARLVSGLVTLGLLSSGILAAGTLVGATRYDYRAIGAQELPWWISLAGILLLAIGNYLHFSAPRSTFGWVVLALVVAYLGQRLGGILLGPSLSGFVGAVVVAPVVLWIESLRRGAPAQITFLPAFWLLVPGAASLIGLTSVVGGNVALDAFWGALAGILGIALGVLIGTALFSAVRSSARGIENFTVELPVALASPERSGLWHRLIPGTRESLWRARRP
ncbi:threonine/serine ThrE exporter family protein [Protaetiibacter larvae]|nr:threonine/serine exporter family protein [Protaetiibacter larvae]